MEEIEYEEKIGELQEKTLECGKLTREIYQVLIKNTDKDNDITRMNILEDIMIDIEDGLRAISSMIYMSEIK